MSREQVIERAAAAFDTGAFRDDLATLIAFQSESQDPRQEAVLRAYLTDAMVPRLERMGFTTRIVENPVSPGHPFLIAHRHEGDDLPTLLTYGHGDVQLAHADQWRDGLDPWTLTEDADRWYGRGIADNKGQHLVNLVALETVLHERGSLGCNVTVFLETGEETGSPGLPEICEIEREALSADLFIASDGPRLAESTPTLFLGSRGVANLELTADFRDGSHHSGNWGGLLANPATVLANAIASIIDQDGRLLVDALRPDVPESVKRALADVVPGQDGPGVDDGWGEPGLTPAERVFAFNSFEVLALGSGDIDGTVNAIPGIARAVCQLRFVPGLDGPAIESALRNHLAAQGIEGVAVELVQDMDATRLDPDSPWVGWALESLERSTDKKPTLLPGIGGSLPNAPFALGLNLPTLWIPHSYPGCSQHAPNEHLPTALVRESLIGMTGLFWDLAELAVWPPAFAETAAMEAN